MRKRALAQEDVAIACARLCDEMKAEDILVLDLRTLTQITDCFVLATGASERQLKAMAERIEREMKTAGVTCLGVEGSAAGGWVLLDYVDVVVHLFSRQARAFYQLEMLWGDAPRLSWSRT